jgi:hypothetical protein
MPINTFATLHAAKISVKRSSREIFTNVTANVSVMPMTKDCCLVSTKTLSSRGKLPYLRREKQFIYCGCLNRLTYSPTCDGEVLAYHEPQTE